VKRTPIKRSRPKKLPPEARAFKDAYQGHVCHACQFLWAQTSHHVVYEQHLRGPDKWRLENAMPVCRDCHRRHHQAVERIPASCLTEQNLQFANDVLGPGAGDYLNRRYA
jgi:5-methylcytosine-specific restriction endonuclease McrA